MSYAIITKSITFFPSFESAEKMIASMNLDQEDINQFRIEKAKRKDAYIIAVYDEENYRLGTL
jgi:hypothetical protein